MILDRHLKKSNYTYKMCLLLLPVFLYEYNYVIPVLKANQILQICPYCHFITHMKKTNKALGLKLQDFRYE